jgi:hypothetical protein
MSSWHVISINAWYSGEGHPLVVDASDITASASASTSMVFPSVTTTIPNGAMICIASKLSSLTVTPDAAMTERLESGSISVQSYIMTQHPLGDVGATGTRTATASANVAERFV